MSRAGFPDPYTDPSNRFSCITNGNIGIDPWLSMRESPVSTTAPPLRVDAIAVDSVAGLPTASNTKSAPELRVMSPNWVAVVSAKVPVISTPMKR